MPDPQPTVDLGELVSIQRGSTYKSALLGESGPVLLGLASIKRNGGFRSDSLRTYGGESPDRLLVRPGEMYASLKDVSQSADLLGSVARLPLGGPVGRLTQDTVRLDIINPGVESDFLYWTLRTPQYRRYCRSRATGTTNLGLPREDFLAYPVWLPPLGVQRRIAAVLGALDDLIETNIRLCKSMSSLVGAMFLSAFGDLSPERKPDWGSGPFAGLVDVLGGGTPRTGDEECWGGDIPWYSVVDAPEQFEVWCIETEKTITPQGLDSSSTQLLPVGATIISARGTVGRLALVGVPMAFNQSCYGLVSRLDAPVFTYFATEALVGQLQRMAHGSVFSTITRSTLDAVQVAVPPASVVKDFESQVGPLAEAIRGYLEEDRQLRRTRDELLPLLMSGRVTPGEVELGV